MTPRVTVSYARTHLSALLRRVEAGERFVITRKGRPDVVLIPEPASDDHPVSAPSVWQRAK